jgi:hypothetical protein
MTIMTVDAVAARPREQVSFKRLLWVAPLTVIVALAVNLALKLLVQAVNPNLARMGQLQQPLITLTLLGSIAAIVVFALVALLTKRPFFWYRLLAAVALVVSWLPDIALGIGGQTAGLAMRFVSPVAMLGSPGPSGPPPGGGGGPPGGGGGGPPGGFVTPIEQVLVLMLLHLATAVVCVVLLTTLTRARPSTAES